MTENNAALSIQIIEVPLVDMKESSDQNLLQFCHVILNPEYCKEWQISSSDFICLTKGGKLLRDTLYRVGGMGDQKPNPNGYFMLLKYTEAYYDDKMKKLCKGHYTTWNPKYLESRWCILDKYGNEKVVDKNMINSLYLVKDSCIYISDRSYYNIETGEFYCNTSSHVDSDEFLFLGNDYDKDPARRGVMKINKKTGTYELFPKTK